MTFEWDESRNVVNREKHRVDFEDAQLAFLDEHRFIERDVKHSMPDEERYYCYGMVGGRILTVRFTVRGDAIRIIGAGYWRKGARRYEFR